MPRSNSKILNRGIPALKRRDIMAILGAYIVPHPPVIIPEVGKGEELKIKNTITAYETVAREIAELDPDTIVIISSHIEMYMDYFHIVPGESATGNFSEFGAKEVKIDVQYDAEYRSALCRLCEECNVKAGTLGQRVKNLDHGSMVPLYFLKKVYGDRLPPIVRIGISGQMLHEHYRLGMIIKQAADRQQRKIVVIASGDLSHKLSDASPYGYACEGPEYDEKIMDIMKKCDFEELFSFGDEFCEAAGECGHRCFVMMTGTLDCLKVKSRQFSYEGPFGIGYGICTFGPLGEQADISQRSFYDIYTDKLKKEVQRIREGEDEYVRLARTALEAFVRTKGITKVPKDASEKLREQRSGAFVCIKKHGQLRGCIGTIEPVMGNVGEEIIMNAMSVAVRDSRFEPVEPDELEMLTYTVDVLTTPEPVTTITELDVKKYGVIVVSGDKRGVLLPDLDSITCVEEQIRIAKMKAGITDREKYEILRFEIERHL